MEVAVNYYAVLVCGFIFMAIGILYYGPLFGKLWIRENKLKVEELKSPRLWNYLINFITAMIAAYVLAHFLSYTGSDTISKGLATTLWLWFGFSAMAFYPIYYYTQKSVKSYLLDIFYILICLLLYSILLVSWK